MTYHWVRGLSNAAPRAVVGRLLALGVLAASASLLGSACADNESSLFIVGCKRPQSGGMQGCAVTNDRDGTYIQRATMDVLFTNQYSCAVLVGNQVVARGDPNTLRTETSRVELYGADVRLSDESGKAVKYADGSDASFTVTLSGAVDPGQAPTPGYGLAEVLLVDAASAQGIAKGLPKGGASDFLATVVIHGRTLGGAEVKSGEWVFPIHTCLGCACVDATDDTCVNPKDKPDTQFCTTDDLIDCRYGSLYGHGTCAQMVANASKSLGP